MASVENLLPGDAPGASPRRCGAPVAIMLYYPDRDFPVTAEESYAPPPPTGAGMAQGGLQIFKKEPIIVFPLTGRYLSFFEKQGCHYLPLPSNQVRSYYNSDLHGRDT